jgi:hypothetical protein
MGKDIWPSYTFVFLVFNLAGWWFRGKTFISWWWFILLFGIEVVLITLTIKLAQATAKKN